jgi:SAM-dependent methyltransferase
MDPLARSAWSDPGTVAGFSRSEPNSTLIDYCVQHRGTATSPRVLDIGCGAGRNAVPLANLGFYVIGTDLSWPMLQAAAARQAAGHLQLALAPMHALPVRDRTIDIVIAHGIWNLARSGAEFRHAVAEAARVAAPGARLFVFTFSRHTLPRDTSALPGETFVFDQFSGSPQVFLTESQLYGELQAAGFDADPDRPLREHNVPSPGQPRLGGPPVIYEAGFRFNERQIVFPSFVSTRRRAAPRTRSIRTSPRRSR